ncbi:Structural maintenance of chromosomes protein 2 [Echinococcus granulosus]|uniref:Structural maintenance of chromosomes protein n=2 Tax=Echinococcus granulosus TaxID=6210 RepID=A0A068WEW7_ECHGR|nr:Structural maintenance of chromosomes protein 2 [Echinococcus granulosus]CDS18261.1 structural maintenance of chromosomes protein 2 [Echinococcus granulosus]
MYIKSMVIDGFKSYCQRTEIPGFDVQFNAITGLNGSGKSNILDAICFLLGITNLFHIRASNLQELVYKGGQAGITKATVSIVFDNTDKSVSPYGYEQFDELTITRQVVVGGKNKYLINGTNATTTRVQDLFHSVQLNVNNPHFLIMQGRITKVLNMKPPEILSLLEEAASTKLYESKKEAALKTIEKKDSKLREIDRVLYEDITPTIRKLREERSSYLEYQKVVREIEHLSRLIVAYDFTRLEEAKQRSKDDLVRLETNLSSAKESLEQLNAQKAEVDQNIVNLTEERQTLLGSALEEAERLLTERQKEEAVVAGASTRAVEHLCAAKKQLRSLDLQSAEVATHLAAKQRAAEVAAGAEFHDLEEAAKQAQDALTEAQANLAATTSGLGGGGSSSKRAGGLAEQARMAEGHRVAVETELRQLEMREDHLSKELASGEMKLAAMEAKSGKEGQAEAQKRRQLVEQITKVNEQLEDIRRADEEAGGDEAAITNRYNEEAKATRLLQARCDELGRQFHQLQFEYTDPTPNFDRRQVYGVVAKLFDLVDPKYATAIEVAAGGKLYNVVVDTETTAKALLERGQLARRVTMLPLNQMRGSPVPAEVVQRAEALVGAENVAPALSLIRYPPHLRPVMEFIFGGLLVCPTLDYARRVAFHPGVERRTITYDGDMFDPQGTLSGGSRTSGGGDTAASLLIRVAQWRAAECEAVEATTRVRATQEAREAAVERARRRADLAETLDRARHQLALVETNLRQSDTHRLRSDLERLKEELTEVGESLKRGAMRLTEAKKAAAEAQWRVEHAQEEEARALREAEAAVQVARKRADAAEETLRQKQRLKETLRLEADELARELEQIKASTELSRGEVASAEAAVATTEEQLKTAKAALTEARARVKEQQRLADAAAAAIQTAKNEAGRLKEAISATTCEIDRLTHDVDIHSRESKEATVKLAQMLESNTWIAEERHHFGVANGPFDFGKRDPSEARQRVAQLSERRDKLSRTVNMRAMNMLGTAEEQYADLLRRREIVLADKRKIQAVIDDLDARKEQVLRAAYDKVNAEFSNIFSSLLPGTRAQLVPPEGQTILEGLQFRVAFGDTWKESLSELSGGQRSLVALALILALLLFKPAPIYILDEVDAALDLSHTQNIGQLIKNHFNNAQFIVVSLKDGMFNNANVLFKTKFVDGVSTVTRHTPSTPSSALASAALRPTKASGDARPHQIGSRRNPFSERLVTRFKGLLYLVCLGMSVEAVVKQVDGDALEAAIKGDKLLVCDFFATWCGPCKSLAPKLDAMAKENEKVIFVKLDVDECQDVAEKYRVTAMPTLIVFKNGCEIGRVVGANEAGIRELIQANA